MDDAERKRRIRRCMVETMQFMEEMNEWGGEHSFIEETKSSLPRIHEFLKSDNEFLLERIEFGDEPASEFKINLQTMNVWAN
jgi:hypothetical protein